MIKIIVVGKMKNKALLELTNEYEKRLSKYDKLTVTELKDSDAKKEGQKQLELIAAEKSKVYVLSEEGKCVSSAELANMLEKDLQTGGSTFIIGGPYGLDESVKKSADMLLSISPMTFTHEWARAILTEQIYRAKSISAGSGYHH